jgi:hypothetical protein
MSDEMAAHDIENVLPLGSNEAEQNARNIEDYRLRVIHERWLSTLILTIHIEIEAMLVELLRRRLPKPSKLLETKTINFSFSQKLVLCEAVSIVDVQLAEGIRAVNKLRNELAHQLDDVPTINALARFIAAMSAMHPLQVMPKGDTSVKQLRTLQQVRDHFVKVDRTELEEFVFVSLLLLRAKVRVLLGDLRKLDASEP